MRCYFERVFFNPFSFEIDKNIKKTFALQVGS